VFLVRELEVFSEKGLVLGAVTSGEELVLKHELINDLGISENALNNIASREQAELRQREQDLSAGLSTPTIRDSTVILVDDGFSTGYSLYAAAVALKRLGAAAVILATPIAGPDSQAVFQKAVDRAVFLHTEPPQEPAGLVYKDLSNVTLQKARQILERSRSQSG
jgi:putative phosphoribosyl transferase